MYGYELIEKLTDEGGRSVELASKRWSITQTVKSLHEFLECVASLGESAAYETVSLLIPDTIHDHQFGDHVIDLTNVESLRANHTDDHLSTHHHPYSQCLAVVVYDGTGTALGTEVPDPLADDIETLCEHGCLNDDTARNTVEEQLIDHNWEWIRHDLRLPEHASELLRKLSDDEARAVYRAALQQMADHENWHPEFALGSLRVNRARLAEIITDRLESAAEEM